MPIDWKEISFHFDFFSLFFWFYFRCTRGNGFFRSISPLRSARLHNGKILSVPSGNRIDFVFQANEARTIVCWGIFQRKNSIQLGSDPRESSHLLCQTIGHIVLWWQRLEVTYSSTIKSFTFVWGGVINWIHLKASRLIETVMLWLKLNGKSPIQRLLNEIRYRILRWNAPGFLFFSLLFSHVIRFPYEIAQSAKRMMLSWQKKKNILVHSIRRHIPIGTRQNYELVAIDRNRICVPSKMVCHSILPLSFRSIGRM